jgi:SAM-dependent methyltransferase
MTALKINALRFVVLFVAPLVWAQSGAQVPANPKFKAEISRQESIYHSEGDRVPSGYTVDRSLANYVDALSSGFDASLASLGPADRWLDIGAGKGQAILDYFTPNYDLAHAEGRERRGKKAQAIAMSIEDRRTPDWRHSAASLGGNQLQYLSSRRLREYTVEELGQFQVITDVIGGFSYTTDLTIFMEKVLSLLAPGGSFYSVLQDVHSEAGTNRPYYADAPFLTEISNASGAEVKVCSWLKSISCVQVTCELKKGWRPPVEAFQVQKVCNEVKVPALAPVHYEAGTPPERKFMLKEAAAAKAP